MGCNRRYLLVSCAVGLVGCWLALASLRGAASTTTTGGQWTTYGGNFSRTSNQPLSPKLNRLRRFWTSASLDGTVYGEPLVYEGRVYVATEADRLYALSASNGHVLWRRVIGSPVPSTMLPCGDITPTVGVTSTMVIDPARNELFVSAAVRVAGGERHIVEAYSSASGKLIWRRDVDRPGWVATAELQRVALALADGRVVVGFGGNYGDCAYYHGFVLGVPESGSGSILSYELPTPREAAVWAPSGVSVNSAGDVFFATGNGASTTNYDEGDSVIELSPSWRRIDSFAPSDWAYYNEHDEDLGSTAPILLPDNRLVIVGKESRAFLLSSSHLGGVGGSLGSINACFAIGGDSYDAPFVYVPCVEGSQLALRVRGNSLSIAWSSPSVSGESTTVAGGLLFTLGRPGYLLGLSPTTGAIKVSVPTIGVERYEAPSAGEGLLVVAGTSQLAAYVGPTGFLGPTIR